MRRQFCAAVILVLGASLAMVAQSPKSAESDDEKGFTSYVQFGGSANSSGRVFKLDTSIGYNVNEHLGFDAGLPFYFVSTPGTSTSAGTSQHGIGNPYLDFRVTFRSPVISYRSTATGYFPVASVKNGFSTGRMTGDWTNRFEHSFSRLTPFAEAGIGNTIRDSRFFDRPFTSLGFNAHVEGGASLALTDQVAIGASGYAILPSGQQRIYSKVMNTNATMHNGRVFDTASETVGTADLARDHGFSVWTGVSPTPVLDLELGYTRSVRYALNTVSFNVGVNVGRLVQKKPSH